MYEILQSSDRATGTNGDSIFYLIDDIKGEYKLHSFKFTNNIYNVTSNNNRIVLANTSDTLLADVRLTEGYYTGTEIASMITSDVYSGFAAGYDNKTGKFTFSLGGGFKMLNQGYADMSYGLLGFDNNDYTSDGNTLTSVNVADLIPVKEIYIKIKDDKLKAVRSQTLNDYSLMVYDKLSTFGSIFHYTCEDRINQQTINLKPTKRLEIKICDNEGNILQISNWCMILEKY